MSIEKAISECIEVLKDAELSCDSDLQKVRVAAALTMIRRLIVMRERGWLQVARGTFSAAFRLMLASEQALQIEAAVIVAEVELELGLKPPINWVN